MVFHRTRIAPLPVRILGLPTALVGRSLVDAAQWARSDREARLIIAAAFQQGLVTLGDVERAAAEHPNATRHKLTLQTARDCAGGSHSLGELDLLGLCRRYRLPMPTRQATHRDRDGRANSLELAGYLVLHYPAFALGTHPEQVARDIREALRGRAGSVPSQAPARHTAP